MTISIQFFGWHRNITGTDSILMPLVGKMKVADALEYVKNRYPALHLDKSIATATVNHKIVSLDVELKENDTVLFLPHIGGG